MAGRMYEVTTKLGRDPSCRNSWPAYLHPSGGRPGSSASLVFLPILDATKVGKSLTKDEVWSPLLRL